MDAAPYFVQVDALYFQAQENGVHYATKNERVLNPDFKYRFGGRIEVGIDLHHDCWQLMLQFLHYHARTRQVKSGGQFFPTWTHPSMAPSGFVDSVYNMWRLHMGLGDINLTRPFFVSDCLEVSPYFGLRYSEIRQKLRIYYQGGTLFPGTEDVIFMKNKFWGVGPMGGIEALWSFNSWLGIFSRGACSLTFGKLYVHQDEGVSETNPQLTFFDQYNQARCILDMAIGLDFRFCTECCVTFYGRIGWEIYLLFGQNQLARFLSNEGLGKFVTNQGDLSIQGLSLGLGISF